VIARGQRQGGRPLLPRSHWRPPCARPRPHDRATCKSRNNQEVACAYQGQRAGRTQIFATIFRPRVCGWIQSVLPVRPISLASPSIERGSLELHQAVHHARPKYLALSRNRGDPSFGATANLRFEPFISFFFLSSVPSNIPQGLRPDLRSRIPRGPKRVCGNKRIIALLTKARAPCRPRCAQSKSILS
jgi:hypothetical protein